MASPRTNSPIFFSSSHPPSAWNWLRELDDDSDNSGLLFRALFLHSGPFIFGSWLLVNSSAEPWKEWLEGVGGVEGNCSYKGMEDSGEAAGVSRLAKDPIDGFSGQIALLLSVAFEDISSS